MPAATAAEEGELRTLVRLAVPLIIGHAGNQLMGLVDTAMVGRISGAALAGVGIGNGVFFALALLGMGCVLGMDALVAQAVGADEPATARRVLWQGLRVGVVVGVPLTLLVGATAFLTEHAGVKPDVAVETRRYMLGRLPNILPLFVFTALRSYVQAIGVTRPIVIAMLVANVVNILANALLIYGDRSLVWAGLPALGLPALGVVGAGLASSLASIASVLVLIYAIRGVAAPADPDRRAHDPALVATIFRLGLPIGLQMLAEVGVFALAGLLAGRISTEAASGHQVAITLASFTFTVTIGLASATAMRVGYHVGRGSAPRARRAGLLGIQAGAAFMACSAAMFLLLPRPLARLLTDKPEVLAASLPLVMIAAVFQISDGVQAVAAGALRGAGDTRSGLVANVAGHYGVGLPVAILLGLHLGLGAPGLWWGLCAGLTAVAVALVLRFLAISARPIGRV